MIGQCDVIAPHVILPFPEPQHAAEDVSGMNSDAHVHVHPRSFTHVSEGGGSGVKGLLYSVFTYLRNRGCAEVYMYLLLRVKNKIITLF